MKQILRSLAIDFETTTTWPQVAARGIRPYFSSGWAFFIPYLAVYVLYYCLKWPVNPDAAGHAGIGGNESASLNLASAVHRLTIPPLLHVYWALHALHLGLLAIAIRSLPQRVAQDSTLTSHASRAGPLPLPSPSNSIVRRLLPWALLALVFYIPGVYLEWPSDPWEHLRRINEWQIVTTVGDHSSWMKSAYFFPYSLLCWCTGIRQLIFLDFYYTGICLLLCWQYYLLSRACGLGQRASMVFVILQAFLFGNNIFSFYRYYGISSSIYAQIAAIALTRIVLAFVSKGSPLDPAHKSDAFPIQGAPDHPTPPFQRSNNCASNSCFSPVASRSHFWDRRAVLRVFVSVVLLLALALFNHVQGVGIAALGMLAVVVWRLLEWKRSSFVWLLGAAVLLSAATVLWFPRNPALDEVYRRQGWLSGLYGFNILSPGSPAFARSLHILGSFGLANLVVGLALVLRRNHITGWLVLMPIIGLILPCFGLPLAQALATPNSLPDNLLTFHRFLLGIPAGLALVHSASKLMALCGSQPFLRRSRDFGAIIFASGLAALFTLGPGRPHFNRLWDVIRIVPNDVQYRTALDSAPDASKSSVHSGINEVAHFVGSPANLYMLSSSRPNLWQANFRDQVRLIAQMPSQSLENELFEIKTPPATLPSAIVPLNDNPQFTTLAEWDVVPSIETVETVRVSDFYAGSGAVQNRLGAKTELLCARPIRVDPTKTYKIEASVRRLSQADAATFLAVAWYDENRNLLPSFAPSPRGAGSPIGWRNGTYSYFGLSDQNPPTTWTTYRTSFGPRGAAAIPARAVFMRVGLLLNYRQSTDGQAQATNVLLWEAAAAAAEPADGIYSRNNARLVYLVSPRRNYTSFSQAGYLSGHWLPQEAVFLSAGAPEVAQAVSRTASYHPGSFVFTLTD